jgi:DNA-binding transcriptional ArsR family regulator
MAQRGSVNITDPKTSEIREWVMRDCLRPRYPSSVAAITALRDFQTGYPDYSASDWAAAVAEQFRTRSVLVTAQALAGLGDWSCRGIEVSQADLAENAGMSQKSVSNAIAALEAAGMVKVSRRPVMSDGEEVWQHPNVYELCIPGLPTWDRPEADGDDALDAWADDSVPEWKLVPPVPHLSVNDGSFTRAWRVRCECGLDSTFEWKADADAELQSHRCEPTRLQPVWPARPVCPF